MTFNMKMDNYGGIFIQWKAKVIKRKELLMIHNSKSQNPKLNEKALSNRVYTVYHLYETLQ